MDEVAVPANVELKTMSVKNDDEMRGIQKGIILGLYKAKTAEHFGGIDRLIVESEMRLIQDVPEPIRVGFARDEQNGAN